MTCDLREKGGWGIRSSLELTTHDVSYCLAPLFNPVCLTVVVSVQDTPIDSPVMSALSQFCPSVRQMMPALPLLGALITAPLAQAAPNLTPALQSFTVGQSGGNPGFIGTVGYDFTTTSSFAVTALGFYDDNGDGLLSSHVVGIFDAATQSLLVSATVQAGTTHLLLNGFRWVSVPEIVLAPGSYLMVATLNGDPGTFDPFVYEATNPVVTNGFILGNASLSESGSGSTLTFPTVNEGVPYGFFGANMAVAAVPEPSTYGLGLGGLALVCAAIRRRRSK